MKINKRWFYGMASGTVVALVLTLGTVGYLGKNNVVNAAEQTNTSVKSTSVKVNNGTPASSKTSTEEKSVAPTKVEASANKDKAAETSTNNAHVEVPVNIDIEKGDQKNADSGSSPWKLDPVFVAQVFVSLKIMPEGIQGDYPIKYEELKLVKNNENEAVVEVSSGKTSVGKVYLKQLIKQDKSGIWTVVGYDNK